MLGLSLRMTLARKGRLVLTSLAIILGTGFLSGTLIFSDTLNKTFDRLFADVFRDVDAYVRSSQFVEVGFGGEQRAQTPISALETVLAVDGVEDATGDIQAFARIIGKDGTPMGSENGPPTFGGIATKSLAGLWTIEEGRLPVGPTEMVMDKATAKNAKYSIGDRVRVTAQKGSRTFTLVGIANYGDVSSPGGATFALFDQPTASEFLLREGYVDAFLVKGDGTLSDEDLAARITKSLDPTLKLETLTGAQITQETQDQIGQVLSFLTIFLTAFSLIALGIGCFVIYNVFSITIAQRLRENALLRAIGASKRQVSTSMFVEAGVIGVIGSFLGFASGIGLSQALSALLNAFGVEIPTKGLSVSVSTLVITVLVGTIVTLVSAIFPALRAGRVPPLAALRDTALEVVDQRGRRVLIGIVVSALGALGITLTALGRSNNFLGFGILFVFAGVIIVGPAISKPVALTLGRPIERWRGVTGGMARQNAARNPKRTARTAAPVLIGVALVTAFTAFAASLRAEIRDTIGSSFRGDYALSVDSQGFGGIPLTVTDQIAKLPQVKQATGIGFVSVKFGEDSRFAVVIDPATTGGLYDFTMLEGRQDTLSPTGVLVSKTVATNKNLSVGSTIPITLLDGDVVNAKVEGVFDGEGTFGNYVVNQELFTDTSTPLFNNYVYIVKSPQATDEELESAVSAITTELGIGKLQSREAFIDAQAAQVNQILGLIYGLLTLSIFIAVVGIVITLLLSVFERTREIGLLRAVGMTRSQVRTTVRWESVITSLYGAVVGVILGIAMGAVLIGVLADGGLSAFRLPITGTIVILVLSFFIGVLASIYPARRATKVNVMRAIAS
ncbi:MAG: ABC transporter permease [Actinobacteria bacterium]|nr:ABC transporter permease [Actinomycetota bacterium]